MAKYYRANSKRGYLKARIISSDSQLELQDIGYGGGAKDRNIPTIANELMQLVIWGVQYPSPGADPDREIVSAEWSTGLVFDIMRAQEGTVAGEHYIGDNVALLFTADMSREILIFEDFEESIAGSIAYTEDTDEDEEMEVLALLPDDEVVIASIIIPPELIVYDSYTEGIDFQKTVYWLGATHVWFTQTFTPDVDYYIKSAVLKLYRTGTPGNITVSIRAAGINGKPTGPDLCTKTINGNAITTNTDGEEVTFLFSTPALLSAVVQYAIVLKSPEGQLQYISWKIDKASATYSGGSTYISYDAGDTWAADPAGGDGDFYFKTYGYTAEDVQYIEEEFKKILVSGGVGEAPYWQFIWAEEVGGTRRV